MNEEERFDFEQKHEEDLQRLRGFRLLDDDFMSITFHYSVFNSEEREVVEEYLRGIGGKIR